LSGLLSKTVIEMVIVCPHIKAKGAPECLSLHEHLKYVVHIAKSIAQYANMDIETARLGAILHDIGKASTVFQERLIQTSRPPTTPFRHEIASCFFLSLFEERIHAQLIEMVIAHHKSILHDARHKGILDLFEDWDEEIVALHLNNWNQWSSDALKILDTFGVSVRSISVDEAKANFYRVYDYCEQRVLEQGYSSWRGLLMAADHFASALSEESDSYREKLFRKPNLDFYNRKHELYPLSLKSSISDKKHTMVVACTGAGKTDYLLRRCQGRVFYTLPFQASINAMYRRIKNDLAASNVDLDIRLLHASSSITVTGATKEERVLQGHVGASIKVLTPHQIAAIAFGTNGYEAMIADIQGCDVILDEIHTYTEVTRSIVLKIVEVLRYLGCRIHIGTATMPSVLYNRIVTLLGKENILQVELSAKELTYFDRHIVHKLQCWDDARSIIKEAVIQNKKVLIVCNQVKRAQQQYEQLQALYPDMPCLLLHSRFRKTDRDKKERLLLGLDRFGKQTGEFNTSDHACIVISTQVVEVSLDISFDVMITEAAPLDALIQRFGRINRKRSASTVGRFKPVYILAPPLDEKEALPYDLELVKRSYAQLPHGKVLNEIELQKKIDRVFSDIDFLDIEQHSVFKSSATWRIPPLTHNTKALLLDLLDIDSVNCICESDEERYRVANHEEREQMIIHTRYYIVKDLRQMEWGARPFILPDSSYDEDIGLRVNEVRKENYNADYFII